MLTQTKAFAGQSLDPVTFMRAFHVFFGDGKTDAGMPQLVQAAENGDLRRASPLWLLEDESEMSGS
ncbi:RNase P [Erwinia sp. B116]|nr:RNase P [Erwinia sp. Leaf53]PLV62418.1 RNase P [Erwinia sp. B116]